MRKIQASALTRSLLAGLWEDRRIRARWALRWRTRDHVQQVAAALAADAASYMVRDLIPADALAATVRHAFLDELADGKRSSEFLADKGHSHASETFYGITPKVARMLAGSPSIGLTWPASRSARSPGRPRAASASPAA
jgi:hypothetical protein